MAEAAPRLVARGLRRSVGGRAVLAGLDLAVPRGGTLVVRGPSGAGKTVLLRALAWLDPLDGGEVRLDGRTPREWGVPAWRARVAWLPQQPATPEGSPADLARRLAGLRAVRHARDPLDLARRLGLDAARWRRRWQELSGGERQRAHLALLLAAEPAVLLLDEPTGALDAEATAAVESLTAGTTRVWVTHDAGQAERLAALPGAATLRLDGPGGAP